VTVVRVCRFQLRWLLELLMGCYLHLSVLPQYLESVWNFGHHMGFRSFARNHNLGEHGAIPTTFKGSVSAGFQRQGCMNTISERETK
jgi:hypothetical protein